MSRPTVRGDCLSFPRPCPFVSCRYHLFANVGRTGSLQLPWGEAVEVLAELPDTCALDVAAEGAHSLPEIAAMLNITMERVRQIEEVALKKLAASCESSAGTESEATEYVPAPDSEVITFLGGSRRWKKALRQEALTPS